MRLYKYKIKQIYKVQKKNLLKKILKLIKNKKINNNQYKMKIRI